MVLFNAQALCYSKMLHYNLRVGTDIVSRCNHTEILSTDVIEHTCFAFIITRVSQAQRPAVSTGLKFGPGRPVGLLLGLRPVSLYLGRIY